MVTFSDMKVFNIIFFMALTAYLLFFSFPASQGLSYLANCLLVGALGGWQTIIFLISELRVPPESLGTTNMIASTVGMTLASIAPIIATIPPP